MSVSPRRVDLRAWLVTGPPGRLVAFLIDLGALLWQGATGRS